MAQDSEQALSGQWQALGAVSPVLLQEAGHYLRYALQWVERGARCCLEDEAEGGDEETQACVAWDFELGGMFSPALGDGKKLGLRFDDGVPRLSFGEAEGGEGAEFVLDGHTDAEARQWVRECVESLSFSATSFNDPVLLPPHPLAEGARYKVAEHREALAELSVWFGNAALLLEKLRKQGESIDFSSADFDFSLRHGRQGSGKKGVSKGGVVGFCGGDKSYPQPYFYVTADPAWSSEPEWLGEGSRGEGSRGEGSRGEGSRGEGSRGVGLFHRQDFSGFVVLGEQIVQLAEQETMVAMFLREAMEIPAG